MRNRVASFAFAVLCMLVCTGCVCEHVWSAADCLNPQICAECQKTEGEPLGHDWLAATCETAEICSRCGEIQGEPLGHTPGDWNEDADVVAGTVAREQYCTVCDKLTASENVRLETAIRDGLFLFTPEEIMDRLTAIAEAHSDTFVYEFISSSTGLQVLTSCDEKMAIIQFFHADATAVTGDEMNSQVLWCMSLMEIGEGDADFRQYFIMACDPALSKEEAFETDIARSAAYLNAAAGSALGYYEQNQLLYETSYILEGTLGQDYSMSMLNIYASDFR